MIQCQGCTCAGWLWEGEGGLGDHQPGVYVPLKALFLVLFFFIYFFFFLFISYFWMQNCIARKAVVLLQVKALLKKTLKTV